MGKILYDNKSVSDVIYIAREFGEPNAQGFVQMVNVEHEVAKIYYGSTLIYEKQAAPTVPVTAYLQELTNCTTDKTFSYTFTSDTTITITPPSISDGQWSAFNYYYVGTGTSGSALNDIVNATYSNTQNGATPQVSVTGATTNVYCSFNHKKGSLPTTTHNLLCFEVNKAATGTSATTTIDLYADCNVDIPDEVLLGRTIRIKGIVVDASLDDYFVDPDINPKTEFDTTLTISSATSRWGRAGLLSSIYTELRAGTTTSKRKIRLYTYGPRNAEKSGCCIIKQIEVY